MCLKHQLWLWFFSCQPKKDTQAKNQVCLNYELSLATAMNVLLKKTLRSHIQYTAYNGENVSE